MMPLPATPVIIALVSVLAVTGWQTYKLSETRRELAEERQATAELHSKLDRANLKLVKKTKEAGDAAREKFDREQDDVADDLAGIDDRIDDLCLQYTTVERAYYRVSVPEAPAVAAGPAPRTGDDRAAAAAGRRDPARTFAAALKRDIRYCRSELNRLSRLQEWVDSVSGIDAYR